MCVFVHVWTSTLGVFCFYKDVKLFFFFHIFGFNESSEVLLNNLCAFSDLFISLFLINYLFILGCGTSGLPMSHPRDSKHIKLMDGGYFMVLVLLAGSTSGGGDTGRAGV